MTVFLLTPRAEDRLDEIYAYTADRWGPDQADRYVRGLFAEFAMIGSGKRQGRRLPVRFGDESFSLRWKSHVIYWRRIDEATIEIVTVLHKAMDQPARLKADQSR